MDTCESKGALCVPPASLVTDPGPEPPRTIVTTFSASDAARTSDNELGWQPNKRTAADVATSKATHAAGKRCADGGGKLKQVFMVVEMTPCQVKKEMGSEVWNCFLKAQVECEKQAENPEHARWEAAKRAAAIDQSRGAQLDAAHEQCLGGRQRAIDACAADCRRQNLCVGASGDPRTSPTRGNEGGTTDRGGRTSPPAQPYNPNAAAEGIARANAYNATLDAALAKATNDVLAASSRAGTLSGPAGAVLSLVVLSPIIIGLASSDEGKRVGSEFGLPLLFTGVGGTFGLVLPGLANRSPDFGRQAVSARLGAATSTRDEVCRTEDHAACTRAAARADALATLLRLTHKRTGRTVLLGPSPLIGPALSLSSIAGL
ncbi:MAG TPA: hypothetical protein VML75_12625, partial [Kofleriaceae bacterium]|nr:hypothetical protein [Kofleriaceae bacterium]